MKLDRRREKNAGNTLMKLNGNVNELLQKTGLRLWIDALKIWIFRFEHSRIDGM